MAVGKPLPDDALERLISALGITNAKGNPSTIPEIELGKIAVQMPFGAMLVHALHAPLEDAEIAFNRVRMSLAAPIFALVVANDAVLCEFPSDQRVVGGFVSHHTGLARQVLTHHRSQRTGTHVLDMEGPHLAGIALDQGENLVLVVVTAALLLATGLPGLVMADEGFVDLDGPAIAAASRLSRWARPAPGRAPRLAFPAPRGGPEFPLVWAGPDGLLSGP